jgi:hypothetical protein
MTVTITITELILLAPLLSVAVNEKLNSVTLDTLGAINDGSLVFAPLISTGR